MITNNTTFFVYQVAHFDAVELSVFVIVVQFEDVEGELPGINICVLVALKVENTICVLHQIGSIETASLDRVNSIQTTFLFACHHLATKNAC